MASDELIQRTGMLNVTAFGIFDTDREFPAMKQSSERVTREFEVEFFLNCTGKAIINDTEYVLSPATVLFCKPGQRRRSIFSFRCYYLHFTLSEQSPYFGPLVSAPNFYRIINGEVYGRIFSDLLYHLTDNENNLLSDYTFAKMTELFYLLMRDEKRNAAYLSLRSSERRTDDFVPRCIAYISKRFAEKISLKTLSEKFHYSPNYIQSVFRHVTGITPQRYLENVRLQQSKILLAEKKESLSQIALLCGFSSQSHFTASFKKRFGFTPRKWQYNADQTLRHLYERTQGNVLPPVS